MKKFMLQLFRSIVTLVILVVMALMIFDLRTRLNEAKRELARTQQELAWTRQLLEERQQRPGRQHPAEDAEVDAQAVLPRVGPQAAVGLPGRILAVEELFRVRD